jgi:hypothetical protein
MDTAQSTSGPAQHVARPAVPVDQHLPAGHAKGHVCTALLVPPPAGSISPSSCRQHLAQLVHNARTASRQTAGLSPRRHSRRDCRSPPDPAAQAGPAFAQ